MKATEAAYCAVGQAAEFVVHRQGRQQQEAF